jgi:hypothetical protein
LADVKQQLETAGWTLTTSHDIAAAITANASDAETFHVVATKNNLRVKLDVDVVYLRDELKSKDWRKHVWEHVRSKAEKLCPNGLQL